MVQEAFTISEKHNTAVIIRETRGFTLQEEPVGMTTIPYPESDLGFGYF